MGPGPIDLGGIVGGIPGIGGIVGGMVGGIPGMVKLIVGLQRLLTTLQNTSSPLDTVPEVSPDGGGPMGPCPWYGGISIRCGIPGPFGPGGPAPGPGPPW